MASSFPPKDANSAISSSFPPKDANSAMVSLPQIPSNPSNHSYFNDQAIWAGYRMPDESRHAEAQRPGVDVTESMEREVIKQRIRAEIIAEEMARRRVLEEEIRMELMLEREMALRRMESSGSRLDSYPGTSQFRHEASAIPLSIGFPEDRRFALPSTMPVYREVGFPGFESSPFQRHPLAGPPEPSKEIVLLSKPETNASGLKRKAPISVSDHHRASFMGSEKKHKGYIGLEKKPNGNVGFETEYKEFKCDNCNIKVNSEIALNDHFRGQKHKAMEQGTGVGHVNRESSALESGINPMKDRKAEGEAAPVAKRNKKKKKKHDKADSTPNSKAKASDSNDIVVFGQSAPQSTDKADSAPKAKASGSNEIVVFGQSVPESTAPLAKQMKYWCEMCQVGSYSPVVFADHEKGKKHVANLKKQHNGAASSCPVAQPAFTMRVDKAWV